MNAIRATAPVGNWAALTAKYDAGVLSWADLLEITGLSPSDLFAELYCETCRETVCRCDV